jgi:glutamine synthetase
MTGMLSQSELESLVAAGDIDTVIVAFCDMQGRLTGKRVSARLFVDDVAEHGAECCNYLLAVDVDMNTVDGYAISSWETGYGDMVMTPDFATLRLIPWLPGTALVMADLWWTDGRPVTQAPRSILNRQIERLSERGLVPYVGTELEFMVFDDGYREAWAKGYRGLTPATDYNVDYAMLASTRWSRCAQTSGSAWKARACCGGVGVSGWPTERLPAHDPPDVQPIHLQESKIADKHGKSLTFMAKFDEREGNSCHIHISLRGDDGAAVFADADDDLGMSPMFRSFIAGQLATLRELTLFYAPNINSYKRFVEGSFAPTAVAWGMDNRTCALRVVGHGHGMRMECRAPGGDVNQYLAVSALIAGGLYGIERARAAGAAGNAHTSGRRPCRRR